MRLATRRHWQNYGSAMRFAAILSAAFGAIAGAATFKPPLLGAALAAVSSLVDGSVMMALIGGVEIFLPRTRLGRWLALRPFLAALGFKAVLYSAVIVAVVGGQLGPRTAVLFVDGPAALSVHRYLNRIFREAADARSCSMAT